MTPRPSKAGTPATTTPPAQEGTPKIESGVQEHHFGIQFAFDVNKQLGKLETGLQNVEKRLEKVETKLDQVQVDVACLQTSSEHIEKMLGSAVRACWGVFIVVLTGLVAILVYWAKAKLGI